MMTFSHFFVVVANLGSVVRGKLYLFGGSSCPDATECLPGVHSFDIGEDVEGAGRQGTFHDLYSLLTAL